MNHTQTIGTVTILVICLSGCCCPGASDTADTYTSDGVAEKTIAYEIVSNRKRKGDGRLDIDVLVSEKESKDDVIKLATFLRGKYAGKYASISIYDSRRALQAGLVEDLAYPQAEYDLHLLLVVNWGGDTGEKEEIRWCAKGREERPANPKAEQGNAPDKPDAKLGGKADLKKASPAGKDLVGSVPTIGPKTSPEPKPKEELVKGRTLAERKAIFADLTARLAKVEADAVKKYGRRPKKDDGAVFTIPYRRFVEGETEKVYRALRDEHAVDPADAEVILAEGNEKSWPKK
jgi:hypothetical protein